MLDQERKSPLPPRQEPGRGPEALKISTGCHRWEQQCLPALKGVRSKWMNHPLYPAIPRLTVSWSTEQETIKKKDCRYLDTKSRSCILLWEACLFQWVVVRAVEAWLQNTAWFQRVLSGLTYHLWTFFVPEETWELRFTLCLLLEFYIEWNILSVCGSLFLFVCLFESKWMQSRWKLWESKEVKWKGRIHVCLIPKGDDYVVDGLFVCFYFWKSDNFRLIDFIWCQTAELRRNSYLRNYLYILNHWSFGNRGFMCYDEA